MKTDFMKKYSEIRKFKCDLCNINHCYGSTQEFYNRDDLNTHMLRHCKHVNVVVRHVNKGLDMKCVDCGCTFGLHYVIKEKQTKFELKNPEDLMTYAKVIENLDSNQQEHLKLIKHILYLQKSWGFYKTKEKIKKMSKKELVSVC